MIGSLVATMMIGCTPSAAPVQDGTSPFPYMDGATALEGAIAKPAGEGKHPAVLIIHDWNGQDAYESGRAKQLADLGYVGVAIDVYGKGVRPTNAAESGAQAGKYRSNMPLFRERLQAAYDAVKNLPEVDSTKIAVIGYCFGGGGALEMGRMGLPLKGIVSFHGGFKTDSPAKEGVFKPKVLIEHAKGDPASPKADQDALFAELTNAKVDYKVTLYDLNVHAFTVPGGNYDEKADKQSFQEMKDFLAKVFA